ncbi:MAG: ferric reductase-like transmembrane domain-containing protein [Ilumatobacteraceae bacterium]
MNEQVWWYLSRASGMVAVVLLVASLVLGVLLSTRALKPVDSPAWLREMHRWLSLLAVVATGGHLGGLVADSYVHIGWREILVPGASSWKPTAVTVGVISLYLLALVWVSSLMMRRLPRRLWRGIHMLSYGLVWTAVVHAGMAGTDVSNRVYQVVALVLTVIATTAAVVRVVLGRSAARASARAAANRQAVRPPRTSEPGIDPVCSPSAKVSTPDLKV